MAPILPLEGPGAPSPADLARILGAGLVVGIPTDTLYGLAADPRSEDGVAAVFAAKGRDEGSPLPVLIGGREQLEALGVVASPRILDRLFALWPAPLTAVLPLREPIAASRGSRTLAVRLPALAPLAALLRRAGPVTATSANRSGEPPALSAGEVEAALGASLALILDGGPSTGGLLSTLVDLAGPSVHVLRDGAFFVDISYFS